MKLGGRGQFLCDECRQCSLGYHCSACSARWRQRAKDRSHARSAARRLRVPLEEVLRAYDREARNS